MLHSFNLRFMSTFPFYLNEIFGNKSLKLIFVPLEVFWKKRLEEWFLTFSFIREIFGRCFWNRFNFSWIYLCHRYQSFVFIFASVIVWKEFYFIFFKTYSKVVRWLATNFLNYFQSGCLTWIDGDLVDVKQAPYRLYSSYFQAN